MGLHGVGVVLAHLLDPGGGGAGTLLDIRDLGEGVGDGHLGGRRGRGTVPPHPGARGAHTDSGELIQAAGKLVVGAGTKKLVLAAKEHILMAGDLVSVIITIVQGEVCWHSGEVKSED